MPDTAVSEGPSVMTALRKKGALVPPFKKTSKQVEAINLMNANDHTMLFGGSRSGKTFIILRQIVIRAIKNSPPGRPPSGAMALT